MPVTVTGIVGVEAVISSGRIHADGNLTIAVLAFNYEVDGKRQTFAGAINQAVTDDDLSYVYLDHTGSLVINTTGWSSNTHIRIGRVTAANGLITALNDDRVLLAAQLDREVNEDKSGGESSTTLTSWQQKLRLTTPALPAGKYVVEWYAEIKHSNTTQSEYIEARIESEDTTELGYCAWAFPAWDDFGGFAVADLGAGVQNLDIDYRAQGGGTAYIRRARILLWRIG
jgi:hypothetical protein